MTHPMIEKLTRAAVAVEMADRGLGLDDLSDLQRERAIASVIAVLRTLRTPDETMVEAGALSLVGPWPYRVTDVDRRVAAETFTAAIDSILPEEKEQP